LKALTLKETLNSLIDSKLPTFIWGSPGIGKSSIVKQIAKERNLEFIDLRLSLLDPTDLKGIPFFDSKKSEALWAQPNFLPKDKNSSGILFLDEINSAPPSVQAAAYQLILDRKIGDYELPPNWAIVAAGNKESDRGVVYKMPSPLSNRFVHLHMEVSLSDWKNWAYKNKIDSKIIAFLSYDESKLFTFDPSKNEKAFATSRSWEYVDKILKSNIKSASLLEVLKGAIGEVAVEFLSFIKVMDELPNIDDILSGKEVEVSSKAEVLFALITALVSRAKNAEEIENIVKFSFKLPSEFAIMLIKDMQQSGLSVEDAPSFEEWVDKFAYLLE